ALELRALEEDLLLEAPERRRRLEPQLLSEEATQLLIGPERLSLAAEPVEGEHEQPPSPFPKRVGGDLRLEEGQRCRRSTAGQLDLGELLDDLQAGFVEPGGLGPGEAPARGAGTPPPGSHRRGPVEPERPVRRSGGRPPAWRRFQAGSRIRWSAETRRSPRCRRRPATGAGGTRDWTAW